MSASHIKLAQADLAFQFSSDEETVQTVTEGVGSVHMVHMEALWNGWSEATLEAIFAVQEMAAKAGP